MSDYLQPNSANTSSSQKKKRSTQTGGGAVREQSGRKHKPLDLSVFPLGGEEVSPRDSSSPSIHFPPSHAHALRSRPHFGGNVLIPHGLGSRPPLGGKINSSISQIQTPCPAGVRDESWCRSSDQLLRQPGSKRSRSQIQTLLCPWVCDESRRRKDHQLLQQPGAKGCPPNNKDCDESNPRKDQLQLLQQPLNCYWGAKGARSRLPCCPPNNKDCDESKPRKDHLQLLQQPHNYYWGAKGARSRLPCCHPNNPNNNWRDWANLDDGPLGLIAERVLAYDVADCLRFRAVCCPWRRSSVDPRIHSSLDRRFHPWRWLMLRDQLAAPNRRRFLNPSTGKCIQVDVPELRDHQVLALTREGLLVLLHDNNDVCLLNPLTRHLTQLPPLSTLLPPEEREYLLPNHTKFAAWGSGILNDDSTVVLYFNLKRMIGIAKPGDVSWRRFEFTRGVRSAISIFAGRLYCVSGDGVMVLEDQPPRLEFAAKLGMRVSGMMDSVHLVECAGELMLVHRRFSRRHDRNNVSKRRYDMYRVDLDVGTLRRVNTFGGGRHALFIGIYCSISVPISVFPARSISGDTIYLSLDIDESDKTEGYHLASRSTTHTARCRRWLVQPYNLVDCLSLCNTLIR